MCVAVVVPAGQRLTEEQIRQMHRSNPDSWGFAYFEEYTSPTQQKALGKRGYTILNKDTSDVDNCISRYNASLTEGRNRFPHLAHFRIATSGKVDISNAHPMPLGQGAMVHNGHFSGHHGDIYSDTFYMARVMTNQLVPGMTDEQIAWLGKAFTSYNKVACLFHDGTTAIINKESGVTLPNGVWVSNTYWRR